MEKKSSKSPHMLVLLTVVYPIVSNNFTVLVRLQVIMMVWFFAVCKYPEHKAQALQTTFSATNLSCDLKGVDNCRVNNSFTMVLHPFWKGIYYKRKEFAPIGSKFFPFRADPFSEGEVCRKANRKSEKAISLV